MPHLKLGSAPPSSQTIAIAAQWNCQLWQRHGMEHIVLDAMTLPISGQILLR
jgi:hypothetical protein